MGGDNAGNKVSRIAQMSQATEDQKEDAYDLHIKRIVAAEKVRLAAAKRSTKAD